MVLSRRRFTKGFKLAAIQRLEEGASVADWVRGIGRWQFRMRCGESAVAPVGFRLYGDVTLAVV